MATSDQKSDDITVKLCKKLKVSFFRGSLNNVASRFYEINKKNKYKYFLRINADSPLIDYKLIDLIATKKINNPDIITNVYKRSFPKGQSVEIFNTKFFQKKYHKIKSKYDLENVTSYFYDNIKNIKIKSIKNKVSFSHINLSVDTIDDLKRIRKIYIKSRNKNWKTYAKMYEEIYL